MKKINKIISYSVLSFLMIPTLVFAAEKEETVYSNLDYYGKYNRSTVVNKLTFEGEKEIQDETELKKILNISGKEKYSLDNGILTWKTDKKDIFYQGSTEKELPLDVNIKYYLNGKESTIKKMKGKKGDIKIVIDIKNLEKSNYQGKEIYTPFVVSVGTIVDATNNTNVQVTNGMSVDTGTKTMVVALASPGLYDSLQLDELKDLDTITISYHTDKFSLGNIYMVATPKLLDNKDLDIFKKVDKYTSKIGDLQNGVDKLQEGSNQLLEGTKALQDELGKKIDELQSSDNTYVGEVAKDTVTSQLNNNLFSLVQNTVYNVVKTKALATKEQVMNVAIQNNCASLENTAYYETCKASVMENITNEQVMGYYEAPTYKEISAGIQQVVSIYTLETGVQISEDNKNLATLIAYQVSGILSTTNYAELVLTNSEMIVPMFHQVFNRVITSYGSIASSVAKETMDTAMKETLSSLQVMYQAVSKINDGTNKIATGIKELNETGIHALTNVVNQYNHSSRTVQQLKKLSEDYRGFASNNSKNTKFIFKVKSAK